MNADGDRVVLEGTLAALRGGAGKGAFHAPYATRFALLCDPPAEGEKWRNGDCDDQQRKEEG